MSLYEEEVRQLAIQAGKKFLDVSLTKSNRRRQILHENVLDIQGSIEQSSIAQHSPTSSGSVSLSLRPSLNSPAALKSRHATATQRFLDLLIRHLEVWKYLALQ